MLYTNAWKAKILERLITLFEYAILYLPLHAGRDRNYLIPDQLSDFRFSFKSDPVR